MIEFYEILIRACIGGCGVALVAAPLGAVMVWRGMAYFGDTLSHSALLGVALAIAWSLPLQMGVLLVACTVAMLLMLLERRKQLANDTLLGILTHSSLAIGLIVLAKSESNRVNLLSYLYGDVLTLSWPDVGWIFLVGGLVLLGLFFLWPSLLKITVNEELAQVEGVRVNLTKMTYILLLAVLIAVSIKLIGALLITALLIIPIAAARQFSCSPRQMVVIASILGCLSILLGILLSFFYDLPTGPSIVVVSFLWFVMSLFKK